MDEVVGRGRDSLLKKKQRSRREISERKRDAFIRHLSETCNVTLSAKRVGVAFSTFYKIRQRDPVFAAAWQGALDDGYQRLEMGLLNAALAVVEGRRPDAGEDGGEDRVIAPMSMDQALRVLGRHEGSVRGGKLRSLRPGKGKMPTAEETDEEVMKRIAILRRQRGWDQL
ncbi:hypothetical protein [Sphingopyxis macrogoltabida]|uniref:hypothetical protein n=1 Tax=Sphingopyxis macrogoltabida TaxID=33050 RepID=UPI0006CA8C7B|nr:hypothetical protein [Sphingopyxis macrogoltabida]